MGVVEEPEWRLPSLTTEWDREKIGHEFKNFPDIYDYKHLRTLPEVCDPAVIEEAERKRKAKQELLDVELMEVELRSGKKFKRLFYCQFIVHSCV